MYRICVFAGTTEGRKLAELLGCSGLDVTACVATEYGAALVDGGSLPENDGCKGSLSVHEGRMDEASMKVFLQGEAFDLVVDATHPYAAEVTENIVSACNAAGLEYLRLLREDFDGASEDLDIGSSEVSDFGSIAEIGDIKFAADAEEAAEILDKAEGNILLTTGSKELHKFSRISGFSERVFARVLPMEDSLRLCSEAGLSPSHIIGMQGPFSVEMNIAQIKATSAKWVVSKDGGSAGGFPEKLAAVVNTGVKLILIGKPPSVEGMSFSNTVKYICDKFKISLTPKVTIAGLGPGGDEYITPAVRKAVAEAGALIGAKRMVDAFSGKGKKLFYAVSPSEIADIIASHPEILHFCVVMSGDTGFYSGTKKLLPLLGEGGLGCALEVLPGISTFSYMAAKLGISYDDAVLLSLHGRESNVALAVRENAKVFALTGGEVGARELCRRLVDAGLSEVTVYVGESLSYPDEMIVSGTAKELSECDFDSLSAVFIINEKAEKLVTCGLPDEAFLRNMEEGAVVPMTKMEVRAVALGKLRLASDSICYDIGAGTGSVSIEMARAASEGRVFAVEMKEKALELLEKNKASFGASNMTVVAGAAPDALAELPAPTHAFIGGTAGNAEEIIKCLLAKNPKVRIVATAIALESVAELTKLMEKMDFSEKEVVSMTVARGRKAGDYNLMMGQNPVYVFTMQG